MTDITQAVMVLNRYFKSELPKLEDSYSWKIPMIYGFSGSGKSGYKENVMLKRYFHRQWNGCNRKDREKLSKIVVSDWGGVRNNKKETLLSYVAEAESKTPRTPIKGVASYSKIYSITDLKKYAIYDARVAVSLNAVQWNHNVKKGIAFNYIPGLNNVTGNALKKIGFVYDDRFKVKKLTESGWQSVKRDLTYEVYLKCLKKCLESFPKYKLYDLEMVLFANSEIECNKAMGK